MKYPIFLFIVLSSVLFLPTNTKAQIDLQTYKLGQQKALHFEQGQTMFLRMKQENRGKKIFIPPYNDHLLKKPATQHSNFQSITNLEDFVDSVIGKGLTWAGMAIFRKK